MGKCVKAKAITRCKDCEHRTELGNCKINHDGLGYMRKVKASGFCSEGSPKKPKT